MLFMPTVSVAIALFSVSSVYAVDICSYTNRNCRSSTFGCCSNVPAGACCFWQYDFLGWSVQFGNMTGNWLGNTYTDGACGVQAGATGASAGATGACIAVPINSTANWFSGRYVLSAAVPGARVAGSAECKAPDILGFTHLNKQYRVSVPEGQFEKLSQLIQAGEWDTLTEIAQEV